MWIMPSGDASPSIAAQDQVPALVVNVQAADLPPEVMSGAAEGDVHVTLHIGVDGSLACKGASSTDVQVRMLTRPSCLLIVNRWQFRTGTTKGVAQASDVAIVVRWKRPAKLPSETDFGGATPISTLRWLSSFDYPIEGMRNDWQDRVGVEFDVLPNGTVSNCAVFQSPRHAVFKDIPCRSIMARAFFLPAIASDGSPRISHAHFIVNFRLPDQKPLPRSR